MLIELLGVSSAGEKLLFINDFENITYPGEKI